MAGSTSIILVDCLETIKYVETKGIRFWDVHNGQAGGQFRFNGTERGFDQRHLRIRYVGWQHHFIFSPFIFIFFPSSSFTTSLLPSFSWPCCQHCVCAYAAPLPTVALLYSRTICIVYICRACMCHFVTTVFCTFLSHEESCREI